MMSLRTVARQTFMQVMRRFFQTDEAREMISGLTSDAAGIHPVLRDLMCERRLEHLPYAELARVEKHNGTSLRDDAIFITARFRSGSTVLWNLFRHLPGCTAYYEPFNERRWFDPATRGEHIDVTHKNADEYWREYDGLEELGRYYREEWIDKQLFMGADFWAPDMKRYIELMIERAAGRPVLQFNRVDFRLPWLRRAFPSAKIIHLYRHPRDQWCSTLQNLQRFPHDAAPATFAAQDGYYLLRWARDLRFDFPFLTDSLTRHPYDTFYYIWRLSYLFGTHYADYSLAFERLVNDTDRALTGLLAAVNVDASHVPTLKLLIERPRLGRWRDYADDAWFAEREARCEEVLADFFGHSMCPDALPARQ